MGPCEEEGSGSAARPRPRFLKVSFSPDGKVLLSHGRESVALPDTENARRRIYPTDYAVRLWNVDKQAELDGFAGGFPGKSAAAISPDGKTLALGDYAGKITIMDMSSRKELRTFADEGAREIPGIIALAYSPNGKLLASWNRIEHLPLRS